MPRRATSFTRGARRVPLFLLACAVLLASGCAAPYQAEVRLKDGQEYGVTSGFIWRSNWWNFYERGQSYASGGFLEEADRDFRWAIERRDADQRNVRTYGMHFLDDYFPHRELGIALLGQGEFEAALDELRLSLAAEPSARAKYFVNEARREILRETPVEGRPKPLIEIHSPTIGVGGSITTNEPFLWVQGTARSAAFIEALDLSGRKPIIELARTEMPFRMRVPLAAGMNRVRIQATDLLGGTAEVRLVIVADRIGPTVIVQQIEEVPEGILFVAVVEDASGVAELTVGDAQVSVVGKSTPVRVVLARPSDARIAIVAADAVGNRTEATIVLESANSPSAASRPVQLAAGGAFDLGLLQLARADAGASPEASSPLGALAGLANEVVWRLGERFAPRRDESAPLLTLHGFEGLDAPLTVYMDRVFVTGNAYDLGEVTRLEINGNRIATAPGRHVLFSATVPLVEGDNRIEIVAEDAGGRTRSRTLEIERVRPAIRDPRVRLAVAPLPFKQGESVGALSEIGQGFLLDALLNQRRYRVVERERLSAIVQELELTASDLIDEDNAIRLGEVAAADAVLMGRVYQRPRSIEAWVRIVDTETSEVLAFVDIFDEDQNLAGLSGIMAGLAQKLALAIPIVEEQIELLDDDVARIAKGSNARIRPQLKVALFRKQSPRTHPITGAVIGMNYEQIGSGRVSEVGDDLSEVELSELTMSAGSGDILVVR